MIFYKGSETFKNDNKIRYEKINTTVLRSVQFNVCTRIISLWSNVQLNSII